jgi:hypothetical protein
VPAFLRSARGRPRLFGLVEAQGACLASEAAQRNPNDAYLVDRQGVGTIDQILDKIYSCFLQIRIK